MRATLVPFTSVAYKRFVPFAYAFHMDWYNALAYAAPTPTRDSSAAAVKAWLAWFGASNGVPEDKIKLLQETFPVNGEALLGLLKNDCEQFCEKEGLKPAIGMELYLKLHERMMHCFSPSLPLPLLLYLS